MVARLDSGEGDAPVIGLTARIGGRELFVPPTGSAARPVSVKTSTTKLDLAPFERRPGEVLLRADVLDRSLINVNTARLVKAREVELVRDGDGWRVAGIDPASGRACGACCRDGSAATTPSTGSSSTWRDSSRSSGTSRRRG